MSGRPWRRWAGAVALAAGLTGAACDPSDARTPERAPPPAPDTTVAALRDALAALPPALVAPLAVAPSLTDAAIRRTPGAECTVPDSGGPGLRRRVRMRLADSSLLIVYVRATPPPAPDADDAAWRPFEDRDGADSTGIARVEVVRRARDGVQMGFVWDAPRGRASVVRWPAEGGYRAEESLHPRNSSLGPALRAAGRRVLALDCPARGPQAPAPAPRPAPAAARD